MRLLSSNADGSFSLTRFIGNNIPSYAILSHVWEADDQEVTFHDLINHFGSNKNGYRKIQFCSEQAERDRLRYFWVDSCCIDKSSSIELQTAINSMFRWYWNSAKCYVYLSDVSMGKCSGFSGLSWEPAFRQSRWFTRGWTLQELLAPQSVEFFSRDGKLLGSKDSLEQQIHEITGIAVKALQGQLSQIGDDERRMWAAKRETTIEEDQVYCLLGIFDVYLPLIYGEGKKHAFRRLQDEIDRRTQVRWSDKECECMQALRTSAFDYEQFKDRNPNRLEGTCQWVLRHEHFRNWKDSSSSGLLWVSADPGCGKSVLSKSLIDQDFKNLETLTTCYFFFKDDNDEQKKITTALSALLHQLLSQKPALINYAMSGYKDNGDQLTRSFHILWTILMKAVADPKAGEICCVLDALDECAEVGRYQIINAISTFYQQASSKRNASRLKFFVTSRPYLDIERHFTDLVSNFPTIRLQGEKESHTISREIDIVIKWRVSNLGFELKLNDSEKSNLEMELLGMTNRTYLWLTLILDIIRKTICPTSRKLKAIISTLPSTVDKAYEAILSRIEKDEQLQARKLLHIIVAAARPFTLKELNIALAIEDHKSYKDLDLDDEARFDSTIRNICGLFVTVIDQKVYLIHQTAKEFLVAKNEVLDGWKHSLDPVESELVIARTCISYLMFDEFGDGLFSDPPKGSRGYLDYAAEFWAMHYQKAQERATSKIVQSAIKICDPRSRTFPIWFRSYRLIASPNRPNPRFISSMMVASYFGHDTVVEQLLESGTADVDSKGENGRTPLSYAAENGNEAVVKLLLRTDQVEADSEYDRMALSSIPHNTYDAVMKLVNEGKSFDNLAEGNVDNEVRIAFLYYTENRYADLIKLLVGDNFKKLGRTPLSYAAGNGHEAVVKLLLETGKIEVNSVDQDYRTPLSYVAENGNEAVVKLLLETEQVEIDSGYNRTPLSYAVWNGHEAVVKLLLETGEADIDSEDNEGRTPLSHAAENGNETMVKLLLEGKADVDSKDNESRTPLSHAAWDGHEAVVKLLLETGKVDVDSKDNKSRTPLSHAAENGNETMVKLLLATGKVDVNFKDNNGKTPMSRAVEGGHEGVVKLLQSFSSK